MHPVVCQIFCHGIDLTQSSETSTYLISKISISTKIRVIWITQSCCEINFCVELCVHQQLFECFNYWGKISNNQQWPFDAWLHQNKFVYPVVSRNKSRLLAFYLGFLVLEWSGSYSSRLSSTAKLFNPSQFSTSMAPLLHQAHPHPMLTLSKMCTFLKSSFSAHRWSRRGLMMLVFIWSVERTLGNGWQHNSERSQMKHGWQFGGMRPCTE